MSNKKKLWFNWLNSGGGGTPPSSDWILATGEWNDSGVWDDTATWID